MYDLNARYYDAKIARFLSPDPYYNLGNRVIGLYEINVPNVWSIMQANALYVYCGNSPIDNIDCNGTFGENTKLIFGMYSEPDIVKLQRQLVKFGYLGEKDDEFTYGVFDKSTLNAVNKYKNDNKLWNYGNYEGVVGVTTWKHLGLKVDCFYEAGGYNGTPEFFSWGNYLRIDRISTDNGIKLGSIEAGLTKTGGDYRYASWEISAVSFEAKVGFSLDYIGYDLEAQLIKVGGGFKIPIPFTSSSIFIEGDGNLFGIGFKTFYDVEKHNINVGATAMFGAGLSVSIIENEN